MAQYFGKESITKLSKTSNTTVSLPANATIRVGGQAYTNSSALTCTTSTSGFGGIDSGSIAASTFYYVYAVVQNGAMGLVASTSAVSPTGFSAWRKVGAFYTDGSSNIFKAYWFGEINQTVFTAKFDGSVNPSIVSDEVGNFIDGDVIRNSTGNYTVNFISGIFSVVPNAVASATGSTVTRSTLCPTVTISSATVRNVLSTDGSGQNNIIIITVNKADIDAQQPDWSL